MIAQATITQTDLLSRRILVVAPHMDDEILGCGGTMLMHEDKTQIYCVYATDGGRSPSPLLPWTGSIDTDIKEVRRREAYEVMNEVGIPQENLLFFDFPDGKLRHNITELKSRLSEEISRIEPAVVLTPFRYDLHPDHGAVTKCITEILLDSSIDFVLLEYFVYYRWRLVTSGDIRRMISESDLLTVDTSSVGEHKSSIISLYRSQTDILNDWQEQPILTAHSISQRCHEAESFLRSDSGQARSAIFKGKRFRILAAYHIERIGKRPKDQLLALLKWLFGPRRKQNV